MWIHAGTPALCCPASGLCKQHNKVRDYFLATGRDTGWSPDFEFSLPSSQIRPSDILLRTFGPRPTAVDVTITHPLRPSYNIAAVNEVALAAEKAEVLKRQMYDQPCTSAGWAFKPFGMEVTGALGPSAERLIWKMVRTWSMKTGEPMPTLMPQVMTGLFLSLAKGVGESLLAAGPLLSDSPNL